MKRLIVILGLSIGLVTAVLAAPLVRQEIRGDKKICYYSDGFYVVVSAYQACPFQD